MSHHIHHNNQKILSVSLVIITVFMLVEAIAGWLSNSLALLSDAGHMFSDAAALALALLAFHFAKRPANQLKSYGYRRIEILVATLNGLTLILLALWIGIEGSIRLFNPPLIASHTMLTVASLGLIINLIVAGYMLRGDRNNLNMQAAFLHVIGDLLGSIGAIIAAILILLFDWYWADPLISLIIALLIAKSGWRVFKHSIHILMEGVPPNIQLNQITQQIQKIEGVLAIHDLHAWSITSGEHALSCHIIVADHLDIHTAHHIAQQVQTTVQTFGIKHVTVQTEPNTSNCNHTACPLSHTTPTHQHCHHHDS